MSTDNEREQRRAASAKFQRSDTDELTFDLQEAMDTAHRSLSSSLRLSFRALQVVMVVLVLLYLLSGLRTVEDSQTGVATLFGSIVNDEGLAPGLQTNWPPPIGGYVVFQAQYRDADVGKIFKPRIDARLNQQQRISKSSAGDGLVPGRDGSLITSGGDLAHIEVKAEWEIIDPLEYAMTFPDSDGSEFVKLALERATVHIVSKETLEELLDTPLEELCSLIKIETQETLHQLRCGIRISDIIIPSEPEPPLYIQKSYDDFDSAKINADTVIEQARAKAHEMLIEAVGSKYEVFLKLINNYELAVETGDSSSSSSKLEDIVTFLKSDATSGKVANKLAQAQGYGSIVELTLGQDATRFQRLLPQYQQHPELVIQRKWLEMYSRVLAQADLETIFVPQYIEAIKLGLSGSDEIAQLRHRNLLKKKEMKAYQDGADLLNPWILRARDMDLEGPARELSIIGGVVQGRK